MRAINSILQLPLKRSGVSFEKAVKKALEDSDYKVIDLRNCKNYYPDFLAYNMTSGKRELFYVECKCYRSSPNLKSAVRSWRKKYKRQYNVQLELDCDNAPVYAAVQTKNAVYVQRMDYLIDWYSDLC